MTDISKTIGELDTLRRQLGGDTPAGWILSNAIEQLKTLQTATDRTQIKKLTDFLRDSMDRLAVVLPPRDPQ